MKWSISNFWSVKKAISEPGADKDGPSSWPSHDIKAPSDAPMPGEPEPETIERSEINMKMNRFFRQFLGKNSSDPDVQKMMRVLSKPELYQGLRTLMEPLIQKAPKLQKFKDQVQFQKALPPMKGRTDSSSKPWSVRNAQDQARTPFGASETKSLIGTPAVNVKGDKVLTFPDVPGVEGRINLNLTVKAVANAMTSAFGAPFWTDITDIVVGPLPGKFGEAKSVEPHTIYINPDAMVQSVHVAVANEAAQASQGESGFALKITPEVERRVRVEVAKDIWETLGHERTHGLDFQDVEKRILETGQGSASEVQESRGEQAGQEARQRFRMNL